MTPVEMSQWLGIILAGLLITVGAIIVVVILATGLLAAFGKLTTRLSRKEVCHSRNKSRRGESRSSE